MKRKQKRGRKKSKEEEMRKADRDEYKTERPQKRRKSTR